MLAIVLKTTNTKLIIIYTNHINIVKVVLKKDNRYKTVLGHLQIIVENASKVISI